MQTKECQLRADVSARPNAGTGQKNHQPQHRFLCVVVNGGHWKIAGTTSQRRDKLKAASAPTSTNGRCSRTVVIVVPSASVAGGIVRPVVKIKRCAGPGNPRRFHANTVRAVPVK